MKIKSVSKSTPKFFTDKSLAQQKLCFNDSKQAPNKSNIGSKKLLKGVGYKNKENALIDLKQI